MRLYRQFTAVASVALIAIGALLLLAPGTLTRFARPAPEIPTPAAPTMPADTAPPLRPAVPAAPLPETPPAPPKPEAPPAPPSAPLPPPASDTQSSPGK